MLWWREGQGHIYLRIPTLEHYKEKIVDHAAGCIIAEEGVSSFRHSWEQA